MSTEHLQQKQAVIDEIKGKLDKAASAVVIDYMGITVAQADAMRKKLREADVDYKVYKNTLVNRAIEGTDYLALKDVLFGPSAFAFSYDDATAPARVLNGVMKEYKKMAFKAGIVEGVFYDAAGIQSVAEVPPKEELLAKFLGSIQSPLGKFVRTLAAIAESKSEDGEAEAPAAKPAAEEVKPAEAEAESVAAEPEATEPEAAEATETAKAAAEPAAAEAPAAEEVKADEEAPEPATEDAKPTEAETADEAAASEEKPE
jgi:large subunit ribosomal protein L10